jgi:phosphatidylinositol dimannoside acyltransferase
MGQPESLRERFGYFQYASMERVAMTWPSRLAERLFRAYGWATFTFIGGSRDIVAANLARVLDRPPDSELVQAATREAFALYARYWFDTFRIRGMPPEEVTKRFHVADLENLDRALEDGKGAILALPHLGNWDVAGHFLCVKGYRLAAVAERLPSVRVFELFLRHRQELGMRIVPLDNAQRVGPQLAQLLADNWLVALVADRDLTGRGVDVEMFGATRKLPAGPALLSLSTGSPLLVCPVYTTEDGWSCRIGRPLAIERTGEMREDVTRLTRRLAAEFERAIAAKPVDWHMFQPAWPGSSRAVLALAETTPMS